jgi:hypothetical protein
MIWCIGFTQAIGAAVRVFSLQMMNGTSGNWHCNRNIGYNTLHRTWASHKTCQAKGMSFVGQLFAVGFAVEQNEAAEACLFQQSCASHPALITPGLQSVQNTSAICSFAVVVQLCGSMK